MVFQRSVTAQTGACCPASILSQILQWALIALLPSQSTRHKMSLREQWKHGTASTSQAPLPAELRAEATGHNSWD